MKFSKVTSEQGHTYIKLENGEEPLIAPPPAVGSDEFWAEFADVIAMRDKLPGPIGKILEKGADDGKLPIDFFMSNELDVAEMVHRDPPEQLGELIFSWLESEGAERRYDLVRQDIMGDQSFSFVVGLKSTIMHAVELVHPHAFATKWHYMQPRPEEAAQAVCQGKLEAPEYVKALLHERNRAAISIDPASFTTYEEGCPRHPSYPAMHAAVGGAAYVFSGLYNLTPEQLYEVRLAQYNWAFGRTAAGVHYASDNFGGLELGEIVLGENWSMLSGEVFCLTPDSVPEKTDWRTFHAEVSKAPYLPR